MKILPLAILSIATVSSALSADEPHQHAHGGAPPEKLGTVRFRVSCTAEAQKRFTRATALLHSFWYEEADKAYRDVLSADPSCGMAWWGIAMSNYHPIWAPPTPAEMARGKDAVAKAKAATLKTDRERDYVNAIAAFYDEAESVDHRTRARRFEAAMERVHRRYPADHEATVFYALALNATALPADKTYVKQKQAAEILNAILPEERDHPGVAHLIIHSLDYPELAADGLAAARVYARIAPSAPHALHMPSHIFTRLGLWQESIDSNLASASAARAHAERTTPGAAAYEGLHALDYLAYAYLQISADEKSLAVLEEVRRAESFDAPTFQAAYALAAVPARTTLERRDYRAAAALTVRPTSFPWAKFPYAEAILHFARAVGAARSGDVGTAKAALARLEGIRKGLEKTDSYWSGQVEIQRLAAEGWIALAEGKREEAEKLLRAAADLEDATEKHPVTPGAVLPAREQLGDLLVELGKPAEALSAYEDSNAKAPGRFNGLAGAMKAAVAAGDVARSREAARRLVALSASAEAERPALKEARLLLKD